MQTVDIQPQAEIGGRYTGDPWIELAAAIVVQAVIDLALFRRAGVVGDGGNIYPVPSNRRARVAGYESRKGEIKGARDLVAWLKGECDFARDGLTLNELLSELGIDAAAPKIARALGLLPGTTPLVADPMSCRRRGRWFTTMIVQKGGDE